MLENSTIMIDICQTKWRLRRRHAALFAGRALYTGQVGGGGVAISIEVYALINFTMNTIIIAAVARSRGRIRWGHVLCAAGFGALYAVAARSGWFPQLNWLPCQAMLAVVLTLVGVRVGSAKELASGTLMLVGGTVFLGGAQQLLIRLLGGPSPLTLSLGAIAGGAALVAALAVRAQRLERWEAQVLIRRGNVSARLTALIDTGNRLHEPLSGLPVLIVEAGRLRRMLPAPFDPMRPVSTLPPEFRLVSYGALGGQGRMGCFSPDELLVSYGDGWMRAPDVWVAVYPGRIPGSAHALAPAVIGRITPAGRRIIKSEEGGRYRWSIPHIR